VPRAAGLRLSAVACVACGVLAAAGSSAHAEPSPDLAADQALVIHFVSLESGLLQPPITPSFTVTVKEVAHVTGHDASVPGGTLVFDVNGATVGPETHCVVEIAQSAHQKGALAVRETAAHEAFHCLQAQLAGSTADYYSGPKWLYEGGAQWVESALVPADEDARGYWTDYLTSPETPLFNRSYDAIGFFGHLAASGISPWSVFAKMYAASGSEEAYAAAVAGNPSFLETEASAFFGAPELGSAWTVGNQGSATANGNVPQIRANPPVVNVATGKTWPPLSVKAYADGIYALAPTAKVTELTVLTGEARLHSTAGPLVNETLNGAMTHLKLCNGAQACSTCPGAKEFTRGDLAIAGGSTGATVQIVGGCIHPVRGCAGLLPFSDFPPGPDTEVDGLLRPIGPHGGYQTCQIQPPQLASGDEAETSGLDQLVTYATVQAATAGFTPATGFGPLSSPSANAYDVEVSPAKIGDQAVTYTFTPKVEGDGLPGIGGDVRVGNYVFAFTRYDGPGAPAGPDAAEILAGVVAKL